MINLLLSIVGPELTPEVEEGFTDYAQWCVLHARNGRLLVDAIGEAADVGTVFMALNYLGRDPKVIGAWTADGELLEAYPFDLAAFLAVAPPDLVAGDDDAIVEVPLTEWREIHRWSGWAPKQLPET